MRHKDANLQLTKKCGSGFHNKAAQYQPDVTVFVYRKQSTYLRLDRALLVRHKDGLHLAKTCGTGFQKAAQSPEQNNQPDVTVYVFPQQLKALGSQPR